jgi:HlyD family secretion protein
MDIPRISETRPRTRRFIILGTLLAIVVVATVAIAQLRPAGAPVARAAVMTDKVVRGPLVRTVRGGGRLVPEQFRWLAAVTAGRVDKILVQPGTHVTADTVIVELSDPQQLQAALDAQWDVRAAEADYQSLKAALEMEKLNQQAGHAQLRAEWENARLRAEADAQMAKEGLVADITRKVSSRNAEELGRRVGIDEHRLAVTGASLQSRLAAQSAELEKRRALYNLRRAEVEGLRVRAGINGVLQVVSVEAGQRVAAGTTLARVVQPERLKAEIRIPEALARDVRVGEPAKIDTHNGIVAGLVSRIDPAAREGAVTVDITTTEPLPRGARPDLTVEATIELGRVADALTVSRPVGAQEQSDGVVFKLVDGGRAAERTRVSFGVSSADAIQITKGLAAGDEIVISDTSAWERHERVEFK